MMMEGKHSEDSILKELHYKYANTAKYKLSNAYVFNYDWESDFFIVQRSSGYCYEIEVKISRSDFFADLKKVAKHEILQKGFYSSKYGEKKHDFRPNKFYYCVPDGLIKPSEVPAYAGLIYAPLEGAFKDLQTVKEAPFLHKQRLSFEDKLCHKFYHYWTTVRAEMRGIARDNEMLRERIQELETVNKTR